MSLRLRQTAGFSALLAILIVIVGAALQFWARQEAEEDAAKLLKGAQTRLLTEARRRTGLDLNDFLNEERAFADEPLSVAEVSRHGQVLRTAGVEMPLKGSDYWQTRTVYYHGHYFVIGLPWYQSQAALHRQAVSVFWTGLTTWALASLAAWFLVALTLRPLESLSRQALERSRLAQAQPLESPSSDSEFRYLVDTLNQLVQTIRGSVEAQGRFYSAASHELRTPLQAMLGHLDLALARERSPEEYRAKLDEVRTQTRRLCDLVQALLVMNQIENAPQTGAEELDLRDVLEARLEQLPEAARERVAAVNGQPCPVVCRLSYAQILVGNLLDNALKYSPSDTQVKVHIDPHRLEIVNQITRPLENPERYFEPFYRPDSSRSSETGGNGLGLALCKAVADHQGWQVSLDAVDDSQVAARVELAAEPSS